MYVSAHRGCLCRGAALPAKLSGKEADTVFRHALTADARSYTAYRRRVCRAQAADEPNSDGPSTSGSNADPMDRVWGSWMGSSDRNGIDAGAQRNGVAGAVPRANGAGGPDADSDTAQTGPGGRQGRRRRPSDDLGAPEDPATWTRGPTRRAQPKLTGTLSRRMEPFARGTLQMESFSGESTGGALRGGDDDDALGSDDGSQQAPDAVCDDDLKGLHSDDDGLQLESEDLMRDDQFAQQLQAAEDLTAIRQVLDLSADGGLSSQHIAQTMLCMGRMSSHLNGEQLQLVHKDPLMGELMASVERKVSQFTPIPLCMTLWGMAAMRHAPGAVANKVIRALEAHLEDFEPRQVASALWAFGRLELHPGDALMDSLIARALTMLVDMSPQALSNIAWACARLRERRVDLLDAIAMESAWRVGTFTTQGLSNLLWAYAKLDHASPTLFAAVEDEARLRFAELSSQSVANILWASASVGRKPEALLARAASEVKACGLQFQPNDLVHMLVALAMMKHSRDERLVTTMLTQCTRDLPAYSPGLLAGILWALTEMQSRAGRAFATVALPVIFPAIPAMSCNQLANLVYSLGGLNVPVPGDLDKVLVQRVCKASAKMTPKQLCGTSWGVVRMAGLQVWQRRFIVRSIKSAMMDRIKDGKARPQEILNVLHDQHQMQLFDKVFISLCSSALQRLVEARQCNAIDLAMTAHVFGKWRWGRKQAPPRAKIQRLFAELQAASVPLIVAGEFTPRQIANLVWGHGKVGVRFSNQEFMHALSEILSQQLAKYSAIDIANVLTGLVGMDLSPGLLALDELAMHLNERYNEYKPFELAQALYAFSRFNYHPGAVVGRVKVMYRKQPELFDRNSTHLLNYALDILDGSHSKRRALGSFEQDSQDLMSDVNVAALIERNRSRFETDEQDYESASDSDYTSDADYADDGVADYDDDVLLTTARAPAKVNKYRRVSPI